MSVANADGTTNDDHIFIFVAHGFDNFAIGGNHSSVLHLEFDRSIRKALANSVQVKILLVFWWNRQDDVQFHAIATSGDEIANGRYLIKLDGVATRPDCNEKMEKFIRRLRECCS